MNTLFHYAAQQDRASIERHGLLPRHPETGRSLAEDDGQPAGVYMFVDLEQARMLDEGDVWQVNVDGLAIEVDPDHIATGAAMVSWQPIAPDRVRWLCPTHDMADEPATSAS